MCVELCDCPPKPPCGCLFFPVGTHFFLEQQDACAFFVRGCARFLLQLSLFKYIYFVRKQGISTSPARLLSSVQAKRQKRKIISFLVPEGLSFVLKGWVPLCNSLLFCCKGGRRNCSSTSGGVLSLAGEET